jgi:molybdopterin-containing oxidoreductase family iron-sulfur binding subunit
VNASVLGLYDSLRVKSPMKGETAISWSTFDTETTQKLNQLKEAGKQIVLLTQTYASPSTSKLISEFKEKYGSVNHVVYDAISESAALDAFQAKYNERGLANYDFSKAETIVSFGADFLGDWQGGGFDSAYSAKRIPQHGKMSRHIQFESNMSLSGANADKRVPLTPTQQKQALAKLHSLVVGDSVSVNLPKAIETAVQKAASELKKAGSNAVVVTGIQDVNAQTVVLEINEALSSKAFDTKTPIKTRQGNNKAVNTLIAEMKAGKVGAIIMSGVNPLYTLPNATDFAEGLKNTELSVAFSMKADETSSSAQYIAAAPHNLESWGDVEFKKGHFGLMQPTIRPLFDTRQFQDVLLVWNENEVTYNDYIKDVWKTSILQGAPFNKALHDGVFVGSALVEIATETPVEAEETPASNSARTLASATAKGMELVLYSKTGMGDGQQANNPWLQEFPDPLTRASWDNYLTVSASDAKALDLVNDHEATGGLNGSYANITVNGTTLKVPVIIQPGQAKGSVGLSFGYGRTAGLKDEMKTGVNAYPLYQGFNNIQNVTVEKATGMHEFACVQLQNTLMGRGDIIKETLECNSFSVFKS